jgi:hypothetical protein
MSAVLHGVPSIYKAFFPTYNQIGYFSSNSAKEDGEEDGNQPDY